MDYLIDTNKIKNKLIAQAKEWFPNHTEKDGILFVSKDDFMTYSKRYENTYLPIFVTKDSLWSDEFGLHVGFKGKFSVGFENPFVRGQKQDICLYDDGKLVTFPVDTAIWQGLYQGSTVAYDSDFGDHWWKTHMEPIVTFHVDGYSIGFKIDRCTHKPLMQNNRIKKLK